MHVICEQVRSRLRCQCNRAIVSVLLDKIKLACPIFVCLVSFLFGLTRGGLLAAAPPTTTVLPSFSTICIAKFCFARRSIHLTAHCFYPTACVESPVESASPNLISDSLDHHANGPLSAQSLLSFDCDIDGQSSPKASPVESPQKVLV